jgi:hypothetical protein
MTGKQTTYAEIAEATSERRDETRGLSIDEIFNKQIVIKNVEMMAGLDNEPVLLIDTADGKRYRTGSKVLVKQAADIKKRTDAGETVTTTIIKKQSQTNPKNKYYSFS